MVRYTDTDMIFMKEEIFIYSFLGIGGIVYYVGLYGEVLGLVRR